MVGTPRRTPRTVLRALLWTLAAGFGVALTVLAGGAASAATHTDDSDVPTPVADLVSDLAGGTTAPLTDALTPVAQPVERAAAPVTQPVADTARSVLGRGVTAPAPDPGDQTAPVPEREPTRAAPERGTAAGGLTGDTPPTVPAPGGDGAAAAPQDEPGPSTSSDRDRDAQDRDQDARSQGESVDVGDLDFGPRSLPGDHGDHGTATAPVAASVIALDDAEAPHVGRDDLLTAVLVPHDTNRRTQNFTRPDVSPG